MNSAELRAYLEHCDEALFKEPRSGLPMAQQGPELARQIGSQELEALALAVLAGAHRMLGEHGTAEQLYSDALELQQHCSQITLADIYRRLAALRYSQGRLPEGISLASESGKIFHKARRPNDEAWAKLIRGINYHQGSMHSHPEWLPAAVQDFTEALKLVDLKTAPRVALGAVQGFALAVAESPAPRLANLETALGAISCFNLKPNTAPYARVLGSRGLIFRYLGCWNAAETLLIRSRDTFAHLGLPIETALISLDLGALYYLYPDTERRGKPGRWERLGEVAAHAVMLFRDRLPAEMLAALALWRDAIAHQELSPELGRKVRRTIATGDPRFLRDDNGAALSPSVAPTLPEPRQALALPSLQERQLTRQAFHRPHRGPNRPKNRPWKGRRLDIPLDPFDSAALADVAENLGVSHAEAMRVAIRTLATQHQAEAEEAERKRWEAPKKPKPWEGLE